MLADAFQAAVARVALEAARQHGFALAGGHALIAHGIITRPTEDVDLFTDETGGVQAAGRLVAAALGPHPWAAELTCALRQCQPMA